MKVIEQNDENEQLDTSAILETLSISCLYSFQTNDYFSLRNQTPTMRSSERAIAAYGSPT